MTNNLPANLSRAIDAMADAAVAIDTSSGDFNYLKLTKAGEWVHGAEDDEVDTQSVFAVDTESFFEDSYRHKKYGKIYTPIINVVGWLAAMPTNDAKPEVVAEPEPEIVAEAEAPRRRRRA